MKKKLGHVILVRLILVKSVECIMKGKRKSSRKLRFFCNHKAHRKLENYTKPNGKTKTLFYQQLKHQFFTLAENCEFSKNI